MSKSHFRKVSCLDSCKIAPAYFIMLHKTQYFEVCRFFK